LILVGRESDGGGFGTVAVAVLFSFSRVLSLWLLEKHRLSGVFVWWLFPSDLDLCGGGDCCVRWSCRSHFCGVRRCQWVFNGWV